MKEHMKGMVFKGNDKPIKNLNKSAAAMKKDDGKRPTSSPFQKNGEKMEKIPSKKPKRMMVSQEGRDIDEYNREEARGEVFSWNPGQSKRPTEKQDKKAAFEEAEKKAGLSPAKKTTADGKLKRMGMREIRKDLKKIDKPRVGMKESKKLKKVKQRTMTNKTKMKRTMTDKTKMKPPYKKPTGPRKKVDPDAPGTPGKPGYEPPVRRSDFDKGSKQQKMFDRNQAKTQAKKPKKGDMEKYSDLEKHDDDR